MTLAQLIMDDKTADETKAAVTGCVRATMMSAIDVFIHMTMAGESKDAMAQALAETERLCVELTLERIHCRVIGKPQVKPSSK